MQWGGLGPETGGYAAGTLLRTVGHGSSTPLFRRCYGNSHADAHFFTHHEWKGVSVELWGRKLIFSYRFPSSKIVFDSEGRLSPLIHPSPTIEPSLSSVIPCYLPSSSVLYVNAINDHSSVHSASCLGGEKLDDVPMIEPRPFLNGQLNEA
eukprot:scaffold1012_cov189-Alexandrium_tamarense.AAC.8